MNSTTNPTASTITCPKCQGTGSFISAYSGRRVGNCFTCKGTGRIFDTPKVGTGGTGHKFPKTIALVREKGIRLHLRTCKIVSTQDERLLLVAPVFGHGMFGTFQADGSFRPNKQCTQMQLDELKEVEEQGLDAVKKIGQLTGICCICGRILTDEGSIAAGIGPICAEKVGGF